jgi:hypothetical protein
MIRWATGRSRRTLPRAGESTAPDHPPPHLCSCEHRLTLCGTRSDYARVFYSIDLRVPEWVPTMVLKLIRTQALTTVGIIQ